MRKDAIICLFLNFQNYFLKEKQLVSETVTPGNLTKNKQAKIRIIEVSFRTLLQVNYRQWDTTVSKINASILLSKQA